MKMKYKYKDKRYNNLETNRTVNLGSSEDFKANSAILKKLFSIRKWTISFSVVISHNVHKSFSIFSFQPSSEIFRIFIYCNFIL